MLDVSSDSKVDDTSKRSDDLLSSQQSSSKRSLLSDHQSTTANSTTTGFTKYSEVSVSTSALSSLASGNGTNTLSSPPDNSRLRRLKSAPSKGFRPKSSVPPFDFGKGGLCSLLPR